MSQIIQYRQTEGIEFRAETEQDKRFISGYGIVFESDSLPMQIWDSQRGRVVDVVEQITSRSLKGADMSDVISAFNHDFDKVLGRSTSSTMRMKKDATGVFYRVEAPKTTYADDVLELIRRGDVTGSSFVFSMDWEEGYEIEERDDGTIVASPKKITKIYEMGPVVRPAYPETTTQNRSDHLEEAVKRFLDQREEVIENTEKVAETPSVQARDDSQAGELPAETEEINEEINEFAQRDFYAQRVRLYQYKKRV